MDKQRNKYFTTNAGNIINRINRQIEQGFPFTPYEFMSLRYACCELISQIDTDPVEPVSWEKEHPGATAYYRRLDKKRKKKLQECIWNLDKWYYGRLFTEN